MIVIKDNLLNTQLQFIAHQVNCQGVMGASGDWNKVTEILEGIEKDYNVLFFTYKLED